MAHHASTAELVSFLRNSTRIGSKIVSSGITTTITFNSAFDAGTTVRVKATPSSNMNVWVGQITTASFDVTSSADFAGATIYYHAWKNG